MTNKEILEQNRVLKAALRFYAEQHHLILSYIDAWDTVSGEPPNFLCDEAGTATVEDGWLARATLSGELDITYLKSIFGYEDLVQGNSPWKKVDETMPKHTPLFLWNGVDMCIGRKVGLHWHILIWFSFESGSEDFTHYQLLPEKPIMPVKSDG